jgi:hypothetical protein
VGEAPPTREKVPPAKLEATDRHLNFVSSTDERKTLNAQVGNVRKADGTFFTGACTHY